MSGQEFLEFQRQMQQFNANLVPGGTVRLHTEPNLGGLTSASDYQINNETLPTYSEPLYREATSEADVAAAAQQREIAEAMEAAPREKYVLVPMLLMGFLLIYLYTRRGSTPFRFR